MFFPALLYHFRHLADFAGRDARQTFWFWFLFLFIINIAVSTIATVPMMIEAVQTGMEAARSGDPGSAEATMMADMSDQMGFMMEVGIVIGLFNAAMMAAPFVRRLHDSGKSGIWAAIAGAIYLASLVMAWLRADDVAAMMQQMSTKADSAEILELQSQLMWQSLLGYVPLIIIVVFGVLGSDPGPNRFGEEPVRF